MLDPLKCGNCSGDTFKLKHKKEPEDSRLGGHGAGGIDGHIVVVCVKCKEVSKIKSVPNIDVDGPLCGGWGK